MAIKLPEYVPPSRPAKRPTASAVNKVQTSEQKLTVAGYNEVVPIVYGRSEVSGPMIAGPVSRNGWAYYGVAISHGPIDGYENIKVGSDNYTASGLTQHLLGDKYEYHLEFYDGTQTTVSPLLQEGIQFFGDVFEGVAYVAVKARGENLNLNNGATFTVRGKKIVDPRDNILKFTENPGLHLYDMVTNSYYGLNRVLIGAKKIADHCDSSFGGAPLSRVGHAIQTSTSEGALIDMLCLYAEAIWGYDGDAIYVVPDAAVPENQIIDLPARFIRSGSVRTFTDSAVDIPNSVTVNFNSDDEDGLAGAPAFSTKEQTTASTPFMNSSLNLMAVYRRSEAQRRADQRLARLQIAGRVSFQMFDTGGELKVGDVLRFPDYYGLGGVLLRVMAQPDMLSPGIYQIHCELYDASIYAETGVGAVVLPKGAVVPIVSDLNLPDGMSLLNLGKDFFVCGSSDYSSYHVFSPDEDFIFFSDSTTTSSDGGHTSPLSNTGVYTAFDSSVGSGNIEKGEHSHELLIEVDNKDGLRVSRTNLRLALVESESGIDISRGYGFFSKNSMPTSSYYPVVDSKGWFTSGSESFTKIIEEAPKIIKTTVSGGHNHYGGKTTYGLHNEREFTYEDQNPPGSTGFTSSVTSKNAGQHSHDVDLEIKLSARSLKMVLHVITVHGASVPTGGIVGFIGDEIPSGWSLCNGENGTLDLVDYFIKFDGDDDERQFHESEMHLKCTSTHTGGRHNHLTRTGSGSGTWQVYRGNHSIDHGIHTHDINYSRTIPFVPRHIKLAFIQYTGESNE